MHSIPPWYLALYEFGYLFHSVIDVVFIVFGFMIIAVVSRPGWRRHLRWANPAAAASVLTGISRLVLDVHHYLKIGAWQNVDLTFDLLNYGANVLSFYSVFLLWRTLRDPARNPASPDPLAEQPDQPNVWPPAPVIRNAP